jgi:hypothetical protein
MNNSPFEIFRRNLKPLMVFLTALALFAFVVLPVLDQYMRQNEGTRNEQVVATFDGQKLTRERAEGFTRGHRATLMFLEDLAQRTLANGGRPQTAGFATDAQNQISSLGINPEPSLEGSIRTFVFAGQASKKGYALSDSELSVWLERFCDGMYTEAELNSLAKKRSSNSMNLPMVKEQLKLHMLAQVFINRGYAGLRVTTPDQTWRSFKKLNEKATANTYAVLVSDYLDAVDKLDVDNAAVVDLFNEGKDRFPNPDSAEVGFRQRYKAKFQYISGSTENFLADEISKLTEEELRAAYKKKVDEQLILREPLTTEAVEPATEPKAEPATEPKAEPATEPKAEPATEPKAEPATEPATEPKAEPATEPATEPKAEPATEPKAEPATEPKAEPAAESKAEPTEGDSSQAFQASAVRLVTTQNQEGGKGADETNSAETDVADEKPADEKPADEKPADEKPADEKPADEKPADEKPADEKPADEKPADDLAPEEPAVGTFEEERADLEVQLATPRARDRLDEAMSQIFNEMQKYFNKEASRSDPNAPTESEPLDLAALAKSYGLTYEEIGFHDVLSIRDEPISESELYYPGDLDVSAAFSQPGFVQLMYTLDSNGEPEKPRFSPLRTATRDGGGFKQYVSWKTEDRAANIPTLDQVRAEVVNAWRMTKARDLATAAATEIANAANAPDATLAGSVPEDRKKGFLNESLPEFQWMEPTYSPRMMEMISRFGAEMASGIPPDSATIGNVPSLDNVGEEFMKAVFTASVNQAKVAMNRTGTVVYVVQPTAFKPADDILYGRFKIPQNRNAQVVQMLTSGDNAAVLNGFFESVDEDAGYVNYMTENQ